MSDVTQMDADLMGSAGFDFNLNQGVFFESFQYFIMGDCFSRFLIFQDSHFLAVDWVSSQPRFDDAFIIFHHAVNQGDISFFDRPMLELFYERKIGGVLFCGHEQARRVFVEAVDDTRAEWRAEGGEPAMIKQGVNQCPAIIPRRGMDDHVFRFIDDHNVVIFVDDIYRDVFGLDG